jgi:hypothetical protein
MELGYLDEAIELLEKANADLEPELLGRAGAESLLEAYAKAERLAAFGVAALARKLDDAPEVARVTGTSLGKAKETVATGRVLSGSADLSSALQQGDISLEQAGEIARAEASAPGAAEDLVGVAKEESFHVLRDKARKAMLEAGNSTKSWPPASAPRAVRAATRTSSAWSTSISPSNPTSGPRSWPVPKRRPRA